MTQSRVMATLRHNSGVSVDGKEGTQQIQLPCTALEGAATHLNYSLKAVVVHGCTSEAALVTVRQRARAPT